MLGSLGYALAFLGQVTATSAPILRSAVEGVASAVLRHLGEGARGYDNIKYNIV